MRPNPAEPARPSESGRTQIWDGRPNPAELRLGTTARIRPKITFFDCNDSLNQNSDFGNVLCVFGRIRAAVPNPSSAGFGRPSQI